MGSVCKQVMEGVAFALRSSYDALAGGELHDSGMCNVLLIRTTVISIDGNWDGNNKGVCQIIQSQKHKALTYDVVIPDTRCAPLRLVGGGARLTSITIKLPLNS